MNHQFISSQQWQQTLFTFTLKAQDFVKYSRVVRSRDENNNKDKNWVQRKLNLKKVSEIRKFLLDDSSTIPVSFIVNICTKDSKEELFIWNTEIKDDGINISENDLVIIDGQHRQAAFDYESYNTYLNDSKKGIRFRELTEKQKHKLDNFEVIIVGYKDLSRLEMASIFIAINKNQRKVSKSVIFDLLHISPEDIDKEPNLELQKALLSGISAEDVKATSIIEELSEDEESCWQWLINIERWSTKATVELWSFVEHLSPALKDTRFLNAKDFPSHYQRYDCIKNFYNILIQTVFKLKSEDIDGEIIYTTPFQQFRDKYCYLSKPSWISILLSKDFFDYIMVKKWWFDKISWNINIEVLRGIFSKLSESDFDTRQYKWLLASKGGYKEVLNELREKIW